MSTDNQPEQGVENEATAPLDGGTETQDTQTATPPAAQAAEDGDKSKSKDDLPIGVQKRFAAMTRQKYEMQQQLAQMQEEMAQLRSRHTEPVKTRDDFLDEQDWVDHRAKIVAQKAFSDHQQAQMEAFQRDNQARKEAETWQQKVAGLQAELPDFADVVASSTVTVPDDAMGFIRESELGPKLAYHFAKHPEEAEALWALTPKAMERKLLKTELRLENETPSAPVQKPVSQAPAPVKGGKGTASVVDMNALSIDEWMKKRNKQVRG